MVALYPLINLNLPAMQFARKYGNPLLLWESKMIFYVKLAVCKILVFKLRVLKMRTCFLLCIIYTCGQVSKAGENSTSTVLQMATVSWFRTRTLTCDVDCRVVYPNANYFYCWQQTESLQSMLVASWRRFLADGTVVYAVHFVRASLILFRKTSVAASQRCGDDGR